MAVASAGPYASLHLTPDRSTPPLVFYRPMPFLPPNQQRRCTEVATLTRQNLYLCVSLFLNLTVKTAVKSTEFWTKLHTKTSWLLFTAHGVVNAPALLTNSK